jgi:hypothetical protein
MNCCAGPGAIKVGQDASLIEFGRNFALRLPLLEKSRIDPANGLYFLRRPRSKNDTIRLQAFMLAAFQLGLRLPLLIQQNPSQSVACRTPLTMVATGLPSFSNCSAQYCTCLPARRQMYS